MGWILQVLGIDLQWPLSLRGQKWAKIIESPTGFHDSGFSFNLSSVFLVAF